jgi:hypothetical protein
MSEDNVMLSYSESIIQTLRQGECLDSHGNTIDELRPAEFTALFGFLTRVVEYRGAPPAL